MRKLSIFCFMVMLCLPGVVRAEGDLLLGTGVGEEPPAESSQEDEWSIGVGVGLGNSPYKGYDTQWSPLPIISYEGEYAYIRGFSAGIKAVNLEWLEVSAFLKYDDTSFDSSDSTDGQMRKLRNRYSSLAAGAEARLMTPYGMLYVNGAGDILDHSNGFSGDAGYMYSLEIGAVEFIPAVGLYWADSDYNDYYYGVSRHESRKSGLKDYDAGGGASPHVGLTVDVSITDSLEVFCSGETRFLESAVKDSPMVDKNHIESLSAGATYSF